MTIFHNDAKCKGEILEMFARTVINRKAYSLTKQFESNNREWKDYQEFHENDRVHAEDIVDAICRKVEVDIDDITPESIHLYVEDEEAVRLLRRLTKRMVQCFFLKYMEDMGDEEIARIIGTGSAAVRNYISKGHKRMKGAAEENGKKE